MASEAEDLRSPSHRRPSVGASSMGSPQEPRGPDPMKEITYAAMENRLRQATIDILEPSIHKSTIFESDLEDLKERVTAHAKSLNEVQQLQVRAHEHMGMLDQMKEEIGKSEAVRKASEVKVFEELKELKTDMEKQVFSLEQKESALSQLHRGGAEVAKEVNRIAEWQKVWQTQAEARHEEMSKRIASGHASLEVMVNRMQQKHDDLTDHVWGEGAGLAKVTGELNRTNEQLVRVQKTVADLTEVKAQREDVDRLYEEVKLIAKEAAGTTLGLKRVVGNVVNEVKEHFRTATNTVAQYNRTFIADIRSSFDAQQASMEKLHKEVASFLDEARRGNNQLTKNVDDGMQELRGDMEELNKVRKRDKGSADIELNGIKKKLSGVFERSEVVLRALKQVNGVTRLMLESEKMQAALEYQDSQDRKKIALKGGKVEYEQETFERDDLILKRRKLLMQAHQAIMEGEGGGGGRAGRASEPKTALDSFAAYRVLAPPEDSPVERDMRSTGGSNKLSDKDQRSPASGPSAPSIRRTLMVSTTEDDFQPSPSNPTSPSKGRGNVQLGISKMSPRLTVATNKSLVTSGSPRNMIDSALPRIGN